MNHRAFVTLSVSLLIGVSAQAAQLGFYVDGIDVDAAAFVNQAAPVANVSLTDLDYVGFSAVASEVTRDSFLLATPAGPSAGSAASSQWLFGRNGLSTAGPSSAAQYAGFTVTADPGFTLNLTNLVFDYYAVSALDGLEFSGQAEAFISIDGGAFNSFGQVGASVTGIANSAVQTANLDLSSIAGAEEVEIRIAFGQAGLVAPTFSATGFAQGITLNGEVVIPEPASLALLAIGGLAMLPHRRR